MIRSQELLGVERALVTEDFLLKAKQREASAWSSIYKEFSSRIYRYVFLKVQNKQLAEDISEMVFLRALEAIDKYEMRGPPFSSWLFRIAHNLIIDQQRKNKGDREIALEEVSAVPGGEDPVALAEKGMALEQVRDAMKQLTKAQQEVVEMRFAAELSIAEIARIMGKNQGAIKALQHSAIQSLRKILKIDMYKKSELEGN